MKDHQTVLVRLLGEIDAVCTELDIPYCCADRLAWRVYRFHDFNDSTIDAFVAVPADRLEELQNALASRYDGREFEQYTYAGSQVVRYLDSNSFCCCLLDDRTLEKPALGVDMFIIDTSKPMCTHAFKGAALQFDTDVFFQGERCTFEGLELRVPKDCDAYFTTLVGPDWEKKKYGGTIRLNNMQTICDPTLPYRQALDLPAMRKAMKGSWLKGPIAKARFREFQQIDKAIAPMEKKRDHLQRLRRGLTLRFRYWEMYCLKEDQIVELTEQGDFETLEKMLKDLVRDIGTYVKKYNVSIYVDEVLYNATKPVLIAKHGESFFKKYDKGIPKKARIDVETVLREGGIDHPLLRMLDEQRAQVDGSQA